MPETLRIGCGAGFQGDRLEPALVLAEHGKLDYLMLECLAERTIALAQLRRLNDPAAGYDSLLERRMTGLLPLIKRNGVRIVTNMGAANPIAGMGTVASHQLRPICLAVSGRAVTTRATPRCRSNSTNILPVKVARQHTCIVNMLPWTFNQTSAKSFSPFF